MHEFEPVFDEKSRILILGSLPSVKSREQGFYYGHPRNLFWRVVSEICGETLPQSIEEKKAMLLNHRIAVWDVVAECDIIGSSDQSIKNVTPTDLKRVLDRADILAVYGNGAAAVRLYNKYQRVSAGKDIIQLPSTSPANAAWSYDRLLAEWKKLLDVEQ